jgi:hypothetical protein
MGESGQMFPNSDINCKQNDTILLDRPPYWGKRDHDKIPPYWLVSPHTHCFHELSCVPDSKPALESRVAR